MNEIRVILSSYNRRELTLRAISQVLESAAVARVQARIWLFDDGSEDGTVEAVRESFPRNVEILRGDGNNYWAKSMAAAEAAAITESSSQENLVGLLWLNDDVDLDVDAISRIVAARKLLPEDILVGAMRDPRSARVTYGGLKKNGRHPLSFAVCGSVSAPERVDTMNGNLVMVPLPLARELGGIDGAFAHAWADVEYGVRAKSIGRPPIVLPGTFGACARNPERPPHGLIEDWSFFTSVKGGGNPPSTRRLLRMLAPNTWVFWWLSTYAKWWIKRLPFAIFAAYGKRS